MPSCLIIVENLPVPFDRRVWQEAKALASAGWDVSVICPKSAMHPQDEEVIDGIFVYRHPAPLEARGRAGFIFEYASALWHETRLAWKVFRRHGIDVIQVCNPPDLLFLVALQFRLLNVKFVYDQHDLCPELYIAKFRRRGFGYWATRLCEWLSYRCADLVITANESFRVLCLRRIRKRKSDTIVIRSFPDTAILSPPTLGSELPDRRKLTIGYVGIIGEQDGVEMLVRAVAVLRKQHRINNFVCRIVGDGPSYPSVKALAQEENLLDCVEFTGYLTGSEFLTNLSSFDIGVIPDPRNSYTDNITMNKVFEYMFLAKPVVGFQLRETMDLVGPCGLFADEETPEALARAILVLIEDSTLRLKLGESARARALKQFSWPAEADRLVKAYETLRPELSNGRVPI